MENLSLEIIRELFKPRQEASNKTDFGHSLLIVGNTGKMGAAIISARACLRSGTGLLTVSVPFAEKTILQIALPEAMTVVRENDADDLHKFTAAGIGCGTGTGKEASQILQYLLSEFKKPIVLDADALNIISADKNLFQKIPENTILTPHATEFDRLFGTHKSIEERLKTATIKSREFNIIIVLKGHKTIITSNGAVFWNCTGNVGLAKGGSGDALTGIITALLSQGYTPLNAAKLGVYVHGLAADMALNKQSVESMLISDVIEHLGQAFNLITCELYKTFQK
jgi:hydroxyethylthiazole kinase-like uncharacterized protein yjeF